MTFVLWETLSFMVFGKRVCKMQKQVEKFMILAFLLLEFLESLAIKCLKCKGSLKNKLRSNSEKKKQ